MRWEARGECGSGERMAAVDTPMEHVPGATLNVRSINMAAQLRVGAEMTASSQSLNDAMNCHPISRQLARCIVAIGAAETWLS